MDVTSKPDQAVNPGSGQAARGLRVRLVRRLLAVGLVVGAGLAGTLAAAAPASATPSACTWGTQGTRGSWASCNSGTGAFQAWVQCEHFVWPHSYYTNYGPWEVPGAGINSTTACGTVDIRHSYGINLS
jgi:hypothetical protein